MAIWIESELWPNLLLETARRGIPMALVNARLSARSYQRWRWAPRSIKRLLGCFHIILARDEQSEGFVRQLGGANVMCAGDLKHAAGPLAADAAELQRLQAVISGRPIWLAASTHPGEEAIAKQVHEMLRPQFPGLLTVIAPRHAGRGGLIAQMLGMGGLRTARRSLGEAPDRDTEIYLADTMGEMGLIYRLSQIAFTGGSLAAHGGQNPLEPARLGCAILHGPHVGNFASIYSELDATGAAQHIADAQSLSNALSMLLRDVKTAHARGLAAKAYAAAGRDKVLARIAGLIEPLLPEPA
jgi:3-deoxy-D-manno-octulosonic-acid transferase